MKKFRKINLLTLLTLLLISVFTISFNVNVSAAGNKVDNGNATYRVEKTVEQHDLGYGITYQREEAYSSVRKGHYAGQAGGSGGGGDIVPDKEYKQQVNLLDIKFDSSAQFVPYAGITAGTWNTLIVRKAAAEYEVKNPGKMVIAAVNGDWSEISRDVKASVGVTISDGEYYKTATGYPNIHTLAFNNSGTGKKISEITDSRTKPVLAIYDEKGNIVKEIDINKVNEEPGNNEISLYYPNLKPENNYSKKYDVISVTDAWVVNKASASITAVANSFYGKGAIEKIAASTELTNGKFAIKSNNNEINALLKDGAIIRCQYEYVNESLKDVQNAMCYPYAVMKNGEAVYPVDATTTNNDAKHRKPRTIIGQREDGSIILATVDGRQPSSEMFGMSSMEMGALVEYYGCVDAWKFDGGGSSTMIIRKQSGMSITASYNDQPANNWHVVNSPSDNSERSDGNCLLIVVDVPEVKLEVSEITSEFVILNVALLTSTQQDKHHELYVLNEGKQYKVENGKVKVELVKDIKNKLMVYGKENNSLNNLGAVINVEPAKLVPTELSISLNILEKNGEKLIEIYYKYNNKNSVKKIEFIYNETEVTTFNGKAYINQSQEFLDSLKGLDVSVTVNASEYLGDQTIMFEDVIIEYTLSFIYNEILYSSNNFMENIFK